MPEIKLERIFENESFVAVDKPAETLSVPGREGEKDPRPVVGHLLQTELGIQIYPVHRLDFEVSGILLFAKTADAHRFANAAFENHLFQKTYQALVPHSPVEGEQRWTDKLVRGKKRSFRAEHGKEAITVAQRIGPYAKNPQWDLWELQPITGRSHQLRVQMMLHQQPIVGDELYGSTEAWSPGIALQAVKLVTPPDAKNFGLPAQLEIQGFTESSSSVL